MRSVIANKRLVFEITFMYCCDFAKFLTTVTTIKDKTILINKIKFQF